jgi:hypothetical protein
MWRALPWLLLVLLPSGWIAFHWLATKRPVAPLWTDADLPAAPPPAENGFTVLRSDAWRSLVVPEEVRGALGRDVAADEAWREFSAKLPTIDAFLGDEETRWQLAAWDAALERPHFADDCLPLEANCPRMKLLGLHFAATLRIMAMAAGSNWDASFAEVERLIRKDAEFLGSARSTLHQSIALANARDAVEAVRVLVSTHRPGSDVAGRLRSSLAALEGSCGKNERALVVEYLVFRQALSIADGRAVGLPAVAAQLPYFDDADASVDEVNRYFLALSKYSKDPARSEPPRLPVYKVWQVWLYNPIGRTAQNVALLDLPPLIRGADAERASLEGEVASLLDAGF